MTPDNAGFATAAYIATAIVYLGYIVSIKLRERRLRERQQAAKFEAARSALRGQVERVEAELDVAVKPYGTADLDPLYAAARGRFAELEEALADVRRARAGAAPPEPGTRPAASPKSAHVRTTASSRSRR